MAVTISDVARKAGVSMKTVSRVVNNENGVSKETRDKVLQAIEKLGYVPNVSARRLASDRSFVICLVVNSTGEYHSEIMNSILEVVEDRRFSLQLVYHDPRSVESRSVLNRMIMQKSIDGLIFTPPCDNDLVLLHLCSTAKLPFVRLTPIDHNLPFPFVAGDDRKGAYDLAQYIISLGHRRIAFLMGSNDHEASQARFEGFLSAMREHNLPINHEWMLDADFNFDLGRSATMTLLKGGHVPTAILCSNDESAAGSLSAAHQAGFDVPGQLSIAGIDDFPLARKVWPSLTTVRQPMRRISGEATRLLFELIEGKTPEVTQICVEEELIIRSSTGPCRS